VIARLEAMADATLVRHRARREGSIVLVLAGGPGEGPQRHDCHLVVQEDGGRPTAEIRFAPPHE
jgi:hypothetical protein